MSPYPPARVLQHLLLSALTLALLGCPAPPPSPRKLVVSLESRPEGGFLFTIPGGDTEPRPHLVLEGPGARLVGVGGSLEMDPDWGRASLKVSSAALGVVDLSVGYSGHGVLYLGGLDIPPTPQTNVGAPAYGWIVLASGATVPFDPNAEGEPIWYQLWEGRGPSGEALRVEIVGSLAFPDEQLRVCQSPRPNMNSRLGLGPKDRESWPGKSPSGVGDLIFDYATGIARGTWGPSHDPGPEVELRLIHNGPWAPGQEAGTAPLTSASQGD